ncbi:hypothetical protein [Ideonella sp.]|uniref:hypothetical protein n=1 Tax=Ideonella sp. TaxID=1929293 RepID=UPI002B488782|nr:hypothetical protein [Ideonella sp.]HJV69398.1 hypothetical protein [Ideonella sp.]
MEPFVSGQFRSFIITGSHWINTMYRCAFLALATTACAVPAIVQAQAVQRNFPQNALRGALVIRSPFEATLNDVDAQLTPGVRIRGQNNMLQMSGALIGAKLLVHYTLDSDGRIDKVWILTPEEAAKTPWPTTMAQAQAWSFDPIAQVWSKP